MNKNLDRLQRKIYLAYHQDGILDIAAGSIATGFSLFMLADTLVFLILGMLPAMLYIPLKERITTPRFGYVRFEPEKVTAGRYAVSIGVGLLVLLVVAASAFGGLTDRLPEAWMQRYHMVPIAGFLFALPAAGAAGFLGLKRFYLYAALAVGLPALGGALEIPTFIPILALGILVAAYGFWLLANFVKQHPVEQEAGRDAQR
jgi:hypothetical protein